MTVPITAGLSVMTWRDHMKDPHTHRATVTGGRQETPGSVSWLIRFPDGETGYRYEGEMTPMSPDWIDLQLEADRSWWWLHTWGRLIDLWRPLARTRARRARLERATEHLGRSAARGSVAFARKRAS